MKNFIAGFVVAVALLLGLYLISTKFDNSEVKVTQNVQKFHCSMHPTYISDKPGNCPICGMKLVPIDAAKTTSELSEPYSPQGYARVKISSEKLQLIGRNNNRSKIDGS